MSTDRADGLRIEVFGCSGGMAEGFRRIGVDFDLVVDKDADAVESYEANLGHRPVQMDVRDLIRLVRLGFRPDVELLVADPPCAPWSTAGKRAGLADDRDMLRETVELVRLLRPRCYLIGNIPGLETEPNTRVVQETIGSLASVGYCTADFARLDAAAYGVPQHRIRPLWFGHLEGPCLRWPAPTHGRAVPTLPIPGTELEPYVTCREALGHLPAEEIGRPVRLRRRGGKRAGTKPRGSAIDEPAHVVTTRDQSGDGSIIYQPVRTPRPRGGGDELVLNPKHPPSRADRPSQTIATTQPGNGAHVLEWPWGRPATTVTSRAGLSKPGHHDPKVPGDQFAPGAVVLSEKAAAILQGFPEDWTFAGRTKASRWSQIGQAMPPALAEAVARSIVERAADEERATAGAAHG